MAPSVAPALHLSIVLGPDPGTRAGEIRWFVMTWSLSCSTERVMLRRKCQLQALQVLMLVEGAQEDKMKRG
jgi:hypothetical protein